MGDIKLGNSTVSKIYYGDSEVTGLYLGSQKIYPNIVLPYKYWWRIRGYSSPIVADYSNSFGSTNGTISLAGTSYGKICASQNSQYVFYTTETTSQGIRSSSNSGASFTESSVKGQFSFISCSDTGQYIIASSMTGSAGNYVALSVDYGVTWGWIADAALGPAYCTAVSRSGQYMFLIRRAGSQQRYYSHDYGATWTSAGSTSTAAANVVCSGNGQYVYYWNASNTYYYVSSDYGVTYGLKNLSSTAGNGYTCSDDGKYVYYYSTTAIYRSSDYGATWSTYAMTIARSISTSCSYDGKHVVMRISDTQFAISDDYGVTFRTENYTCNTTGLWVSRM